MSYSCKFSFKKMEPAEIIPFLISFKRECVAKLAEIAKETFVMCPFNVEHVPLPESFVDITIDERRSSQQWAHNSVFKFKYFYNNELKLLGVSGVYEPLRHLFDGTVHFQDSTDRDYSKDLYDGIEIFEKIFDKWACKYTSEIASAYQKKHGVAFDDMIAFDYPECGDASVQYLIKVDYFRRIFCYDEIWSHFENNLWDDENNIFFSVFGNSERQEIMRFVKYCYDEQINLQKNGGW